MRPDLEQTKICRYPYEREPSDDLPRASHSHLSHSAIGRLTSSAARFIAKRIQDQGYGTVSPASIVGLAISRSRSVWWRRLVGARLLSKKQCECKRVNELTSGWMQVYRHVRLWMREQTITAQFLPTMSNFERWLELLALEDDTQGIGSSNVIGSCSGTLFEIV